MKIIYIPKTDPRGYIQFPAPENPEDFYIAEVADDFTISGLVYDPAGRDFKPDVTEEAVETGTGEKAKPVRQ